MKNLFEYPPPAEGEETLELLLRRGAVRIERIASNRARTEWYDQDEEEWVVLLEGTAELEIEARQVTLKRGDMLHLPAHCRHRVLSTSDDALWLAVFMRDISAVG
ncbi:cupin domain-containing protein [Sulfurimonas diazotrophicus]|uniref:Cupin domain-containing protein n=1 Tax=Sulfurimonas diazotrophicus TaxID=3131939 RepID=A0ABZ3HE77_9BACT